MSRYELPEPSPLERWCARSPRVRWPLVFLLIVFLWGLAGWLDSIPLP